VYDAIGVGGFFVRNWCCEYIARMGASIPSFVHGLLICSLLREFLTKFPPRTYVLRIITKHKTLGIVHVLTGPDHLSAIATLSANVGSFQAFLLGVRWGIGHSTGLLLVGVVLIYLTLGNDAAEVDVPEGVSKFFESLVGVFMCILGVYGIKRSWDKKPKSSYGSIPEALQSTENEMIAEQQIESAALPDSLTGERQTTAVNMSGLNISDSSMSTTTDEEGSAGSLNTSNDAWIKGCSSFFRQAAERISSGTMAILAGIIHGMAGPGGVLGVIPAVQLHNWKLASIYLGCFCGSSTVTMGIFAMLYGTVSSKIGGERAQRQFLTEFISACLSIFVGIMWLALLLVGKLDDIFP